MINKNLKNRLLYLPLDLHEKVLLWLTYKGLKPVSEISASRRGNALSMLRRGIKSKTDYDFNSNKSIRIRKWISDAGLYLEIDPKHESTWYFGKVKDQVKEASKIIHNIDVENIINTGRLFGFPEKAVEAYTSETNNKNDYKSKLIGTGHLKYQNLYLKNKYYTPYIFYNMSKGRVKIDSKVAKTWADCIQKDLPVLAKWFEKDERNKNKP